MFNNRHTAYVLLALFGVVLCALIPGWLGILLSGACGAFVGYHLQELDRATRRGV